ncbi:MAG: glycosyltransferase family 2 protein [Deltaproteobacteria bacterium]|jgi:glycosyltransferase involved in cell wall biosynthesis|nr:glycosyltransferase family 2 protein [Deltaproteobacteria bacterium]
MILTTIIPTFNEILNIEPCLESVAALPGEVLVIDESNDGTGELAEKLGARVIRDDFAHKISAVRNCALENALGDYVFFLDADERVTPKLALEIQNFLERGEHFACSMRRHNVAFGRRVRFGPLYPDWVIRLFPTQAVTWEGNVHERPIFKLPVKKLKGPLIHHTYCDFASYLKKQGRYAELWAEEARQKGKTATPWKAVNHAFLSFLKMFFFKLGFLGGPVTWSLCWYYSSGYTLGKYLLLADPKKEPEALKEGFIQKE